MRAVADLGKVTREAVGALDEIDAGERRALWQFVSAHKAAEMPKAKPAAAGAVGGGSSGSAVAGSAGKKATALAAAAAAASGYQRHWPDDAASLRFVFRSDLPTDAFSVIIKQLYN